ncbi:MAG TPA: helical backbone metal receptor, partial [Bryobacteraceae bacterium]|nr:helical backbone metal receptor [Bryobacteraceae bacterium]
MRLIAFLLAAISLAAAPAQRIISTGPSITEILFALGLGSQVVGATEYCKYPPEAQKIPRIGTWMTYNMEAILQTRPTLVIVQKTEIHDDSRFRAKSLRTVNVELDSIPHILDAIRSIGAATATEAQATRLIARIRAELDAVR